VTVDKTALGQPSDDFALLTALAAMSAKVS
jgi:hypothetical protein